jgi:pimeloyl-ACP methyl ester carboxylesterase
MKHPTDSTNPRAGLVQLPDALIEYFDQGEGEPVVMLPGGSLNVTYMQPLADALARAGYRVVRINPRGAGRSLSASEDVTLHDLAEDVAGVIQKLQLGPVHILGHAFGNRVARTLAADHPELIRSVILLAAGGKVPPSPEAQKALQTIFDPRATDEDYLAAMSYMVGDPDDRELAWRALKPSRAPAAAGLQATANANTPLEDWWAPPGDAPYLVLQGMADQAAPPENGELLKRDLGDRVTLVPFEGAGHLMLVTRPDEVARAIVDFLQTVTAR